MAKENKTKYAILGVLSIKPCTGYDIKKFCDDSIAHFWQENYGHIYPVLKQLEQDGWVSKTTEISDNKLKNIYSITNLGMDELKKWLSISPESPKARFEFLLKIFFSNHIPADIVIKRIEESVVNCQRILEKYKKIESKFKDRLNDRNYCIGGGAYRYLTLRYGILNMEANIKWCEESLILLKSLKEDSE